MVILKGEGGIGKSFLCREFVSSLLEQPQVVDIYSGQADTGGSTLMPFQVFRKIFSSLLTNLGVSRNPAELAAVATDFESKNFSRIEFASVTLNNFGVSSGEQQ